jgi:hypothetical protein
MKPINLELSEHVAFGILKANSHIACHLPTVPSS